jgi:hypothetical protein
MIDRGRSAVAMLRSRILALRNDDASTQTDLVAALNLVGALIGATQYVRTNDSPPVISTTDVAIYLADNIIGRLLPIPDMGLLLNYLIQYPQGW